MLLARGQRTIGQAELRWAFTFVPGVWCVSVQRTGLLLDTRFVPAATEPARPRSCLYLLVRGAWIVHAPEPTRIEAPRAFVTTEQQLDGGDGARPFLYAASGSPFEAIELHVRDAAMLPEATTQLRPLALGPDALEAARAVVRLAELDDATLTDRYRALLERLADEGLLARSLSELARRPTRRAFVVLWSALRPMVERLYLSPTLQEVGDASGVSTRQTDRHVRAFVEAFGLVGDRWRATTLYLRLKLAVMLLSAEGASVGEVASMVGYGSLDAMARAFRDAGMAPPSVVQQEVQAARRAG